MYTQLLSNSWKWKGRLLEGTSPSTHSLCHLLQQLDSEGTGLIHAKLCYLFLLQSSVLPLLYSPQASLLLISCSLLHLLLLLQIVSLVLCAFSVFAVSHQRNHPFSHQGLLPFAGKCSRSFAFKTEFSHISFHGILEAPSLSTPFLFLHVSM